MAGRGAVGEGLQVTAGEAGCRDDDICQAPVKREEERPLRGLGGAGGLGLVLLLCCHMRFPKKGVTPGCRGIDGETNDRIDCSVLQDSSAGLRPPYEKPVRHRLAFSLCAPGSAHESNSSRKGRSLR